MLEVHIPSVGPEKGHMVSRDSGWEGARGPTEFPRAECNGDPAFRAAAAQAVGGHPAEGFWALGFASPADGGPGS